MNTLLHNFLLNTDSYKASHYLQYPADAEFVSSYVESRGSDREWADHLFYGLQMYLKEYLSKPITQEMIDEAEEFWTAHGEPFNRGGWQYILNKHGGYLPIEIEAVPEGTVLPTRNVLMQIVNTDPKVPWLTSYTETSALRSIWYPTTVATQDLHIKRIIKEYLDETADDTDGQIGFKLHDFGGRGVSSMESAGIGGSAHLVNFLGTDTVSGALFARRYYGESMPGFSIPAAEHSTITCWGGPEEEIKAFENMIDQFAGEGKLYATVSDSYDIYAACDKWGLLRDKIINAGGTLVVRPDSGHPPTVVVEVIERLMALFGKEVNSKGYFVLPPFIRVIQGDGIDEDSIRAILENMKRHKLSAENVAFGMGGAMLQQLDRDTLKFAMKASAIKRNGMWKDVYKDPVGDVGKKSKRGRLALIRYNGEFKTIRREELPDPRANQLVPVFRNGKILRTYSFSEVRERAAQGLTIDAKRDTLRVAS